MTLHAPAPAPRSPAPLGEPPDHTTIEPCIDGRWMIVRYGHQWSADPNQFDPVLGCGTQTWPSAEAAHAAITQAKEHDFQ